MKEIRIGKFKVEDVGNGVKFTSLSGLEVFVEDKEDPRQNTLLRLAMGDIDGEDAKKLAEFLEKNNKNNILKYLVNNRPCIFMEGRPFKKTPEKDMGPLEKEILMQRKWYKRFFIKKGELTKNEIKKIELLGALKFEEAKLKTEFEDLFKEEGKITPEQVEVFLNDEQAILKKEVIKEAMKKYGTDSLANEKSTERFKNLLNALPKEFLVEIKDDLVEQQKAMGEKIRNNKKGGGTMFRDTLTRMKNILKLGYIPEADKSDRTKLIDRQKAIGEAIRSSDASVIPKFIRSTLGMTKKDSGRGGRR